MDRWQTWRVGGGLVFGCGGCGGGPPSTHFSGALCVPTGHGMDSRPAMAIFELLDYIVNEVWRPDHAGP